MTYTVTITSQGQISIPVALRRKYSLDESRSALVRDDESGNIVVSPIPDFLSLKGILKTKKRIPFEKIREDFQKYRATRVSRKFS